MNDIPALKTACEEILTHFCPRLELEQAIPNRNNGKPVQQIAVNNVKRSRNDSDLPLRQPTDQKAGGSNPSRRTKSPRNRLISRTFAFHKFRF